jgi:hypothetical protein
VAPAPPATRPERPRTVTVAAALMATAAGILLMLIVLAVVYAVQFDELIDAAARATAADPEEVSSERESNLASVFAVGVPCLIMAVWLVATLVPILRGSNTGRILAFVGISTPVLCGLCCGAGGLVATSFLVFSLTDAGFDESWPEEDPQFDGPDGYTDSGFYDRLYGDGTPVWSEIVGMAGVLIIGALLLAAVALLLVPASNRYFRPRAGVPGFAMWHHSQPYPQPGYPQPYPAGYLQPGYPQPYPAGYAPPGYPAGSWAPPGGYWAAPLQPAAPPPPPPAVPPVVPPAVPPVVPLPPSLPSHGGDGPQVAPSAHDSALPPAGPAGPASAPDSRPAGPADPPAGPAV